MISRISRSILLVPAILLGACPRAPAQGAETGPYAVTGVSVVDVENGRIVEGQTVIIEGERIAALGPSRDLEPPLGARAIDGAGLYLLPGLFDAHVHYIDPETFGPLLIASGVTFVRETGNATEPILLLRDELNSGKLLGPGMIATGAIIDGDPPVWPFSEACDTPEAARRAVAKLAEKGVDQIKVYTRLKKEVYFAAVEEARRRGLKVIGHVPSSVTLEEALAAGQSSVEHLDGFGELIARLAGAEPGEESWSHLPRLPREALERILGELHRAGLAQCPTLVVTDRIARLQERELREDPLLELVPRGLIDFWDTQRLGGISERIAKELPHRKALVAELYRAGVPLLCGTDLANPYLVPGHSLHEEMQLLVEAGVPPAAVLRAATLEPARFCGMGERLGSVSPGKLASLVLVRGNPLEDIRHAAAISAVFLRGRFFDRAALDALIAGVKEKVRDSIRDEGKVELHLPGKVLQRGRYRETFNGLDAGVEDFLITESEEGYHVKAHNQPHAFRPHSVTTFHTDKQFRWRSAEWRRLTGRALAATYRLEGASIRAEAVEKGKLLPAQSFALPEQALFSGPAHALEFLTLGAAALEVGQTSTFTAVGFGFLSWEAASSRYTLTRHEDVRLRRGAAEVEARFYTAKLETPAGEFSSRIWTDTSGRLLKKELRMPIGTAEVTLE